MKKLIIFFAILSLGCNIQGQVNVLPAQRPNDLTLTYHVDGGMRYYFENINIAADSCVYVINNGGKKTHSLIKLSNKDLDDLYAMLKKNQFNKIEYSTKENVYDRGGISIEVGWNNGRQRVNVSNAQNSFVKQNWEKEWGAVCKYIKDLANATKN